MPIKLNSFLQREFNIKCEMEIYLTHSHIFCMKNVLDTKENLYSCQIHLLFGKFVIISFNENNDIKVYQDNSFKSKSETITVF